MIGSTELMRQLRASVAELEPVVARRPGGVACSGFLERIQGPRRAAQLVLHPVGVRGLGESDGPLSIHAPERGWTLVSTAAEVHAPDVVCVPLADARLFTEREPKSSSYQARSLYLTCPQRGDLHTFPVCSIGRGHCVIDAPPDFHTGEELGTVELLGDEGPLRRCGGVVREVVPWYSPHNRQRFWVRIDFVPRSEESPGEYELVSDPDRIRQVLELASLLQLEAQLAGAPSMFARLDLEQAELHLEGEVPDEPHVELRFDLFAASYETITRVTRVTRVGRGATVLALPLVLRRRRRRAETRARIPKERDAVFHYRNPVSGRTARGAVQDLSLGGLCFDAPAREDALLWEDLPLRDARLEVGDFRTALGDVQVRHVGERRVHLAFNHRREDPRFADLLAELRHPSLEAHDGASFEAQLALYRDRGLLMPHMNQLLEAAGEDAALAWRRAHTEGASLCRTLARYEDGEAVASVTALQAWDRVWLGQHLAAQPRRRGCTPGTLLLAFLDHVILKPDCRYMVFFAAAENAKMNRIHTRFQELTGTSEAVGKARIQAWLLPRTRPAEPTLDGFRTVGLRRRHRALIEHAATREMGALVARGLGLDAETLTLARLRRRFAAAGLVRRRELAVLSRRGRARMAMVTERCSPSLCIPGILDGTWLLPLHGSPERPTASQHDDAVRHALRTLRLQRAEPVRLLLAPGTLPTTEFERAGLEHAFDANVYVLNRAGLRRYVSFLMESYGAAQAHWSAESRAVAS
ncbi:MAG TPA: hypothetical protein RMH85_26680 [Polyangiaceae bacterium LLY-WYZ-15_(1-7)]|nr:hypothetical protein [Polyangiaceae bacterium LLY-WYZ-15_(1-7)]HJL12091.1 hypothetical protein [Polyangiaceae bacterium LLY-WYZ-15_(1-7)]HJL35585.1 hypothetical protein [Polyangiaceae bacterium LLY-WYZ-15_(1-7)]HJL48822.1 hypothetical protein [Polyangiaceae bacterium LLY-WYZ-15_(1-7)]